MLLGLFCHILSGCDHQGQQPLLPPVYARVCGHACVLGGEAGNHQSGWLETRVKGGGQNVPAHFSPLVETLPPPPRHRLE